MSELLLKDEVYTVVGAAMKFIGSLAQAFLNPSIKRLWRSNYGVGIFPSRPRSI